MYTCFIAKSDDCASLAILFPKS